MPYISRSNRSHSIVMQCRYASQLSSQTSVIIEVVAELTSDNYRVVQKKRYPSFNFAITSVNVHRL